MDLWTFLSVLTDIMLGGMAYNLAIKLGKIQATQGITLTNHESRITALEAKGK